MLLSTDGRIYVFGVFEADGYECKTLVALAEDEGRANHVAERHRKSELSERYVTVELLSVA